MLFWFSRVGLVLALIVVALAAAVIDLANFVIALFNRRDTSEPYYEKRPETPPSDEL